MRFSTVGWFYALPLSAFHPTPTCRPPIRASKAEKAMRQKTPAGQARGDAHSHGTT
jgi:hypothetical protein